MQCSAVHCDLPAALIERDACAFASSLRYSTTLASNVASLISVQVRKVCIQLGMGERAALASAGDDRAHGSSGCIFSLSKIIHLPECCCYRVSIKYIHGLVPCFANPLVDR